MTYYLAVDIGASGGRHILGRIENGQIVTLEVYRFENSAKEKNGWLVWDVRELFSHILDGMRACKAMGKAPISMGIDTWGVDFVLLDSKDEMVGDAVSYRDKRTDGMEAEAEKLVSFEDLYELTGIQKMPINSIYQLMALKLHAPAELNAARSMLMIPDYFNYLLTGIKRQEYTNATTTALVNAHTKTWDDDVIKTLGFPAHLFEELSPPGTRVGPLSDRIAKSVGFGCMVTLPATHDTGSAFLAVPAKDENSVYLSSGTWSLLGIESENPIISEASRKANFSNEGGFAYRTRFLKNIMGLWMIQSVKRQHEAPVSYAELEELARIENGIPSIVNVNDALFLSPKDMREAVRIACRQNGQPEPAALGQVVQSIYHSLALSYKYSIEELRTITGRDFERINIVGGGCKDGYLNELTAMATGLPVFAGPEEATVVGNLAAQMIANGGLSTIDEARALIEKSFDIKQYLPE